MTKLSAAALAAALVVLAVSPAMATNINLTNKADNYTLTKKGYSVHGMKGDDRILSVDIKSELYGDDGNDILIGRNYNTNGVARALLFGGPGNDSLFCDGTCTANGGPGDDKLSAEGSTKSYSTSTLLGGAGKDTFSLNCPKDTVNCILYVQDMTLFDKLRIVIPNISNGGKATNLLDVFDIFDVNHDGYLDSKDVELNSNWAGFYLDANRNQPGEGYDIVEFYSEEIDDVISVQGVYYLSKTMLIR